MPGRGVDVPVEPAERLRRPDGETVRAAARTALGRVGDHAPSQAEMRRLVLPILRDQDPGFALGGRRMRTLLLDAPGVRIRVRYRTGADDAALEECPVCGSPVRPIANRTLFGETVVLGFRCTHCAYWTHRKRRVPVRYSFSRVGRGRSRSP